jgi:hypothetical protein
MFGGGGGRRGEDDRTITDIQVSMAGKIYHQLGISGSN